MALIEMRQITHRYSKNDAFILKDFSLSVEAGQHLAITGPSGSGKSTLLSILRQKSRAAVGRSASKGGHCPGADWKSGCYPGG